MLQQEFEKLVGMTVTSEEYNAIEMVYMASDVNKYEFCALWKQMNPERVKKAKADAKAKAEKEALKEKLSKIYYKYDWKPYGWKFDTLVHTALGKREEQVLEQAGIELKEWNSNAEYYLYKRMTTILHEIRMKLRIA